MAEAALVVGHAMASLEGFALRWSVDHTAHLVAVHAAYQQIADARMLQARHLYSGARQVPLRGHPSTLTSLVVPTGGRHIGKPSDAEPASCSKSKHSTSYAEPDATSW